MTHDDLIAALTKLGACDDAIDYVRGKKTTPLEQLWAECCPGWQLWVVTRLDRAAGVTLALDCAKLVLSVFEHEYPDDSRPRKAIEAGMRCLEIRATAAADAAYAAGVVAEVVAEVAEAAAHEAAAAACAAAAADAACAAAAAAACAAAADASADAAYDAADAAYAAAYAACAAADDLYAVNVACDAACDADEALNGVGRYGTLGCLIAGRHPWRWVEERINTELH